MGLVVDAFAAPDHGLDGPLTVDGGDPGLCDDRRVGLAFTLEEHVAPHLACGASRAHWRPPKRGCP